VGARHFEASAASLSSPEWPLKDTRGVWLKRKCVTILNLIFNFVKRLKSIYHYMTSIAQIIGGTFHKNSENGLDTCSILSSRRICHTFFLFFNQKGCTQNLIFFFNVSELYESQGITIVWKRRYESCATSSPRLLCMNWALDRAHRPVILKSKIKYDPCGGSIEVIKNNERTSLNCYP
jgi:hypothetical protein